MTALTKTQIEAALRDFGLRDGDIVLLHSSLSSLGRVEGGADAVVDAFLGVLGAAGTLVVPIFGALGIITETVKARPNAVCSVHPLAAVAAIGRDAEAICAGHWKPDIAHAEDTPYMRIAERGGYVCLLGVDQDRNTTLHTVEERLRLPYLRTTDQRTFDTPEGRVTKAWRFFPGPHRDFIGLERALQAAGALRVGRIGNAAVRLMRSRELIDVGLRLGRENPAFVLCENPNCADCVGQRATLRRARLARESFTVATSSALAGRWVPEMLEACAAAGIAHIELDMIEGRPIQALPGERVKQAVAELRGCGLTVTALRLSAWSDAKAMACCELAAALGIRRLVAPLCREALALSARAAAAGVALSLVNTHLDSAACSRLLLDLRQDGGVPGFTFNAANFARAGENPFLGSYKQKLRRFVDQLDVEDATADGTPRALAEGHAEIKELISILRCASFPGLLVLGAGNRHVGDLRTVATRFVALLDALGNNG